MSAREDGTHWAEAWGVTALLRGFLLLHVFTHSTTMFQVLVLGTRARMGGRRYLVLTELLVPWGTQTNKQANNNCRLQWVL